MIRKVKFSNFYSFYKEQEIDFLAKKKKTYDYYESKSGDQITKVAGFIGANASGKTNIMRLFSFLGYFVCREFDKEPALITEIAYKKFFNNDEASKFFIEFEIDEFVYSYNFSIEKNQILEESLDVKKIKKYAKKIKIFSRQLNSVTFLNKEYFKNISVSLLPKIREDVSFIAFMKKLPYSVDLINNIYDYFSGFKSNITEKGEINNIFHQIKTLDIYLKDEDLKKEVEEFICAFDVGLDGFEIKKEIAENKGFPVAVQSVISIRGIHSAKSPNNKLDFNYESRGTQSLFYTMANILSALKNNNVVIIDEIETGFHPEALNKLISYFIDKDKEHHAQMIFSSHSFGFMKKLDMHQIFLTEKNDKSESSVIRLSKVKGIRPDENFLGKYMTGVYGGFPKIRV